MKSSDPSKGPSGKRYSETYKQEALALIDAGRSQSQVSRDLGVSVWTLGEWRKRSLAPDAVSGASQSQTHPSTAELLAENTRLRKQLAKAEIHSTILKKALAIIGQEPPDLI